MHAYSWRTNSQEAPFPHSVIRALYPGGPFFKAQKSLFFPLFPELWTS